MEGKKDIFDIEVTDEFTENVIKTTNRHYAEVTITKVNGHCPYGHQEGETFQAMSMNHANLCGTLWNVIQPAVFSLQYGGSPAWEKEPGLFNGLCPEMGIVQIQAKQLERDDSKMLRTAPKTKDMTGKGFAALDKYRVFIEILGVANHCMWAHREGQKMEIDPFNIGKLCGNLYHSSYHFLEILFAGSSVPWEAEEHIIHGVCPDIHNQTTYRLIREER